ncbi:MAG: L,D-transpeptidase family protein [Pseudomonadota bacterium]
MKQGLNPTGRRFGAAARFVLALLALLVVTAGTPEAETRAPAMAAPERLADRVVVDKSARRLRLLRQGAVIAEYRVALGFEPDGHKRREGDGRTPEGLYQISWRNPESAYHLSLFIDYPNPADRAAAEARGEDPGGEIFIHGGSEEPGLFGWLSRLFRDDDWTAGCIAVTDAEMEEIWALTPTGVPIEIRP